MLAEQRLKSTVQENKALEADSKFINDKLKEIGAKYNIIY
jgi:hypothetical protein